MQTAVLLVLALALLAGYLLLRHRQAAQYMPAPPADPRKGVHFGYFGSVVDQWGMVRDHVDLWWYINFYPLEQLIAELKARPVDLVFDFGAQLFEQNKLRADATDRVMAVLTQLSDGGVLACLRVVTLCDEPNTKVSDPQDVYRAHQVMQECVGRFPDLHPFYGAIFAPAAPPVAIELFDIVGPDPYSEGSNVLAPGGAFDQLMAQARPDAQGWTIPGAAYGQVPEPFVRHALGDKRVYAVVAFCHFTPQDDPHATGLRYRNGLRDQYAAAGRALIGSPTAA